MRMSVLKTDSIKQYLITLCKSMAEMLIQLLHLLRNLQSCPMLRGMKCRLRFLQIEKRKDGKGTAPPASSIKKSNEQKNDTIIFSTAAIGNSD